MESKKIVGIILAYNAEKTLADLIKRIPPRILDEIFVANDGSTDNTAKVAAELGLRLFSHPNIGYGGNLKFGLQKALEMGADYAVEIHGDNQYDPAALIPALDKINSGADLIIGSRFTKNTSPIKNGMPMIKFLANKALSWLDRIVFRANLSEFHSGFRVYSRHLLESIRYQENSNDYLFSFQIISQAIFHKLKIAEVPVVCVYHQNHSSINISKSVKYALQSILILIYFLLARAGLKRSFFLIKF